MLTKRAVRPWRFLIAQGKRTKRGNAHQEMPGSTKTSVAPLMKQELKLVRLECVGNFIHFCLIMSNFQITATSIPISQIKAYFREWAQSKCSTLVGANSCDEVDSSRCNYSRQRRRSSSFMGSTTLTFWSLDGFYV